METETEKETEIHRERHRKTETGRETENEAGKGAGGWRPQSLNECQPGAPGGWSVPIRRAKLKTEAEGSVLTAGAGLQGRRWGRPSACPWPRPALPTPRDGFPSPNLEVMKFKQVNNLTDQVGRCPRAGVAAWWVQGTCLGGGAPVAATAAVAAPLDGAGTWRGLLF